MHDAVTIGTRVAPRRAWTVVAQCTLAYVLSFVDRQMLSLPIEPVKADLAISDTQFSLLNGLAFAIFCATMGLPLAGLELGDVALIHQCGAPAQAGALDREPVPPNAPACAGARQSPPFVIMP